MDSKILKKLCLLIKDRKKSLPKDSYTSTLFKKGKIKIANKLGEEATETISAFLGQGKREITEEAADLFFHLLVLLEFSDLSFDDVMKVLEERMKND